MRNPLTKEAFAEWCEKQPKRRKYIYCANDCACAQYAKHLGVEYRTAIALRRGSFWQMAEFAAVQSPYTFGALAQRLRA